MTASQRTPRRTVLGARAVFTGSQTYPSPPEEVFPMLCPVREYEYLPPWECDIVYPEQGLAEAGGVFTTSLPKDGGIKDVWVISRYEQVKAIEFVRVNELRTMLYTIELERTPDNTTIARWQQTLTGLSPEGNSHVRACTQEEFTEVVAYIEDRLRRHLAGEKAPPA